MRALTNDIVLRRKLSGSYNRFWATCSQLQLSVEKAKIFVSIYVIESFYRPVLFRMVEYAAVLGGGAISLAFNRAIKNYTIGVCQLGLSTILNYYGGDYYQHSKELQISNIRCFSKLLSVISLKTSIKILEYRIEPILQRAQNIYPNSKENQICYIGEQFNGRYSYGLMLNSVYEVLENHKAEIVI